MDQVGAMYQISEILSKAFKEVNDVCAHYLADQSVANVSKQQRTVEKKQLTDKPNGSSISKTQLQHKKQQKVEVTQSKSKTQPIPQSSTSPRPNQQSKPKQVQKQQTQSKSDSKKAAPHPDKPKQPLSAFFLFTQDQKENVQKLHPKSGLTDLTRMMGEIWRGLNQAEKAPYIEKADQLKVHYNKKLQKFYEKHPEEKTKKQLKKEKRESKVRQESQSSSPLQKAPAVKPTKKQIVLVEQQENSESI